RYRLYRWWQTFIHRHGWHHTKTLPAGYGLDRRAVCDWCGLSGVVMDAAWDRRVAAEMAEAVRDL
ncbi:hypothetical protein, partial [Streptomyces sp. NPDC055990]|uniref:hypothetical protein n=1 Tax=Streptomyces sp. NPDC055990 TaxID=3345672 RepID=UPI0035DB87E4